MNTPAVDPNRPTVITSMTMPFRLLHV